jgi:tRNA threonylcarbamoyladenosine biosynthesis protein TsaE
MPVLLENDFDFLSHSPEQTRRLGMRLGALLQPGDVICLQGDLGAGKTTLVQGLAAGWGSLDAVSSPTFILVNVYRRSDGGQLFHFDTYRIESAMEAEELDLEAMISAGPLVIEWPERMATVLPAERLWIHLEHVDDDRRQLTFRPVGKHYETLLSRFRQTSFGAQ